MFRKRFFIILGLFIFVLIGCKENEAEETWEQSSLFEAGGYSMLGIKDKIGFIYEDNDIMRFYPNKEHKYMWHIWLGDNESGSFKVKATHQDTNEEKILIDVDSLGGPNNGADAHLPSSMSLPLSGMWKLDTYLDDVLFETIYVKVYEESK